MRPVKKHIAVLITATGDETEEAIESAKQAALYADDVYVAVITPVVQRLRNDIQHRIAVTSAKLIIVPEVIESPRSRNLAFAGVRGYLMGENGVVLFLEAAQHVDEPELVRPSAEFNDGKILTATRYFQWNDDHFRIDGIYVPARFPVMGEYRSATHWDNALSTAPAWMWSSKASWVEAPFSIVDRIYTNAERRMDDGVPKLQPTRGRLFA